MARKDDQEQVEVRVFTGPPLTPDQLERHLRGEEVWPEDEVEFLQPMRPKPKASNPDPTTG